MPSKLLSEDWSDYDNRKIRDKRDGNYFACEESWEKDYLIRKIEKAYPQYSRTAIESAITQCCRTVPAPRPRKAFVECVMQRLRS